MTDVDPYVIRIPERITERDGRPTPEFEAWLVYDNRFKHDLWQQTGGGDDILENHEIRITANETQIAVNVTNINSNTNAINTNAANIAVNSNDIDALEALNGISVISQGVNYTTIGNVLLRATAGIQVTLNATPDDREFAIIYHDGAANDIVTVTDGSSTDTITKNNSIVTYTYYSSLSKWVP